MKYSVKQGEDLTWFLSNLIKTEVKLIGSLGKGIESDHDIDVLMPNRRRAIRFADYLKKLLEAEKFEYTDWGGIYLTNTRFGDIDIFFSDKDFTY